MAFSTQVSTAAPRVGEDKAAGPTPTRRGVLKAGATAAALGAVGWSTTAVAAQIDQATPSVAATPDVMSCVLTAERTEGPYYLEGDLIRRDITEGKEGVPLRLKIVVADPTACTPLANAAVDIWHCDAHGYYSGISSNSPGGDADPALAAEAATQKFLRGIQVTDGSGAVEFETIYPGWYAGRTVHIHLKVTVEGTAASTYDGGHVAHTGQLFFDDAITDKVFALEPYVNRPEDERTTNDDDNIFGDHEDEPGFLVTLTPIAEGSVNDGYLATVAIGVDPSATPSAFGGRGRPPAGDDAPPPAG